MHIQHQIFLSLGSNIGHREACIVAAIEKIHLQIGTVQAVSGFYESPSWGYNGAAFLNVAVAINSTISADELLKKCQFIEQSLGRTARKSTTYEDRCIDIDIIAYNDLVLESETLQVPHPQMAYRNFVLKPMQEIAAHWQHPILKKDISTLLQFSKDTVDCSFYKPIDLSFLDALKLQPMKFIAIEGNIGAGKTTLASKLADDFNAKLVLERFADNPFLPKFYEDQQRFAFPLEMSFLADRYQQLVDDLSQLDLFKDFIIADYHFFKSMIFAKVTLGEDEFKLYKKVFDIMYKEMPKPDLYIYLYQNTERLLQNIKNRGRSYEQQIPEQYLEKINQGYLHFIKTQTAIPVLIIDISEMDFVTQQEDYIAIIAQINARFAH